MNALGFDLRAAVEGAAKAGSQGAIRVEAHEWPAAVCEAIVHDLIDRGAEGCPDNDAAGWYPLAYGEWRGQMWRAVPAGQGADTASKVRRRGERGRGRHTTFEPDDKPFSVRLTKAQRATLDVAGGGAWIRGKLDEARTAMVLTYDVAHNGDASAGILPYSDAVTVTVASADPGGDPREFAEYVRECLAEWFDGARVTRA